MAYLHRNRQKPNNPMRVVRRIDMYSYPSLHFSNRLRAFSSLDLNIHFFFNLCLKNETFIKTLKKVIFFLKENHLFSYLQTERLF